jgi:hypothetical protein
MLHLYAADAVAFNVRIPFGSGPKPNLCPFSIRVEASSDADSVDKSPQASPCRDSHKNTHMSATRSIAESPRATLAGLLIALNGLTPFREQQSADFRFCGVGSNIFFLGTRRPHFIDLGRSIHLHQLLR